MKKILAALFASAFIIPALATSATAGDEYPGTVNTSVSVKAPSEVSPGESFTVKSTLNVNSARPAAARAAACKGKIRVVLSLGERVKARGADIRANRSKSFKFKLNTRGTWTLKSSYIPKDNSPCKESSKTKTIQVG